MRRVLIICLMFWNCIVLMQSKTYIVSVGVSDYPGSKSDLTNCVNDAVTIKELFEKNNSADVVLLTNQSAKLSEVVTQMEAQFAKATQEDAIIFFFSGHGVPGGFVCYDHILPYKTINKVMAASSSNKKMVFSDACYSGKARTSNKHSQTQIDASIMFFLSSRTGETSIENRSWRNSFFTGYLERGLRGGADYDKNRIITASEIFQFVSQGVKEITRDKQHPVMWGKFDNDMPIMIWNKE